MMKTLNPPMQTDKDLLEAYGRGDTLAFTRFYRLRSAQVFHYLLVILRERGAAEDVMQSVFVKVHANLRHLLDAKDPSLYLLRMARNAAVDYRETRNRTRTVSLESVVLRPSPELSVADQISLEEQVGRLQRALFELDEESREVVVLHRLENRSLADIAEVLGVPASTLSYRYRKALQTLKEKFGEPTE